MILEADSMAEMERLSEKMSQPESVCYPGAAHCMVFPQACTVSLEMKGRSVPIKINPLDPGDIGLPLLHGD